MNKYLKSLLPIIALTLPISAAEHDGVIEGSVPSIASHLMTKQQQKLVIEVELTGSKCQTVYMAEITVDNIEVIAEIERINPKIVDSLGLTFYGTEHIQTFAANLEQVLGLDWNNIRELKIKTELFHEAILILDGATFTGIQSLNISGTKIEKNDLLNYINSFENLEKLEVMFDEYKVAYEDIIEVMHNILAKQTNLKILTTNFDITKEVTNSDQWIPIYNAAARCRKLRCLDIPNIPTTIDLFNLIFKFPALKYVVADNIQKSLNIKGIKFLTRKDFELKKHEIMKEIFIGTIL